MQKDVREAMRAMVLRGNYITNMDMLRKLFPHGLAWGNRLRNREVRCTSHARRIYFRKTRWVPSGTISNWFDTPVTDERKAPK